MLEWFQKVQRDTRQNEQDAVILITGYEGSGKSTLAFKLARRLDESFTTERVVFDSHEVIKQLQVITPGQAILFDEAVNGAYSRNAMSKENKVFTGVGMIARAKCPILLMCLPNKHNLDGYFRDHRVAWWFHVHRRGFATLYEPKRSPWNPDVFWSPFCNVRYGKEQGGEWAGYQAHKMRYIENHLQEWSE